MAPFAKLLGFYLGPKAGSQNWEGPLRKYANRLQSIKHGQASVAVNAFTYNTRVVPVTSYVAQLIPLPDTFVERFGIFSVIRCPNCMRHSDMFELYKYGGPKPRSISVCTELTEHGSDLAQNGAEVCGNKFHNSTFGASEFVPASELVELGYPVSFPSVVEPAGDPISVSAPSSLT